MKNRFNLLKFFNKCFYTKKVLPAGRTFFNILKIMIISEP
jgi:hypothetical protein